MRSCFNDLAVSISVIVLSLLLFAIPPRARAEVRPSECQPAAARASEGRLLYANDDDWDWVSPKSLEADRRSKLSNYGLMEWSALDTMEGGLPAVRGLLVGSPPLKHLSIDQLNELRAKGKAKPYRHVPFEAGSFSDLLRGDDAPNVVILMHHKPSKLRLTSEDIIALAAFVRRGGRVLLLDDWGVYDNAFDQILKELRPKPAVVKLDPNRATRARGLVVLLGDGRFAVRDKATRDLIAIGKQILPVLHAILTDDPEVKARIQYVIATLDPPRVRGPQELSNEAMQSLHVSLRTTSRDVELRTIKRNARGTPGYALVVRFPQGDTAEPAPAPTVRREKTNIDN